MQKLKKLLDKYYECNNTSSALSQDKPDPLLVAKSFESHPMSAEIALICALLSYGSAKMIVQTLQSLDFSLLQSFQRIKQTDEEAFTYYRFQTRGDIKALFLLVASMLEENGLRAHFHSAFNHSPLSLTHWKGSKNTYHARMLYSIYYCIDRLYHYAASHHIPLSKGLYFALGTSLSARLKDKGTIPQQASALKRWHMLLRWLVRKDKLDMGLWQDFLSPAYLILPLDIHTFRLCNQLKILDSKHYNLQSALRATDTLALLHKDDPIRYDFALYRLGQSGAYKHLLI